MALGEVWVLLTYIRRFDWADKHDRKESIQWLLGPSSCPHRTGMRSPAVLLHDAVSHTDRDRYTMRISISKGITVHCK
jgi:hypothetical protein